MGKRYSQLGRPFLAALVLVTLSNMASVGGVSRVVASGGGDGCNPGRPVQTLSNAVGTLNDHSAVSSIGGARGNLLDYSPYVVPGSVSAAWTMLTVHDSNAGYYAQIGWLEYGNGDRRVFTEQGFGGGIFSRYDRFAPYSINSVHNFEVDWRPSGGTFAYFVDGAFLKQELDETGFVPTVAEAAGEKHNWDDQMPGGQYRHQTLTNLQIYAPGGTGAWYWWNADGKARQVNNAPLTYGEQPYPADTSLNATELWDWACP